MKSRSTATLLGLLLLVGSGAAGAADPADYPALEWIEGRGAAARIQAIEGVVFVDLYAHY